MSSENYTFPSKEELDALIHQAKERQRGEWYQTEEYTRLLKLEPKIRDIIANISAEIRADAVNYGTIKTDLFRITKGQHDTASEEDVGYIVYRLVRELRISGYKVYVRSWFKEQLSQDDRMNRFFDRPSNLKKTNDRIWDVFGFNKDSMSSVLNFYTHTPEGEDHEGQLSDEIVRIRNFVLV